MRAESNGMGNDSVHVQFSDSVNGSGTATMQIGTSSSAEVILQGGDSDTAVHNWGWADNGWNTLGANVYFASTGTHTVRIQQREDGAIIDQIVLSPDSYLSSPPGARDDDATILPATGGSTGGSGGTLPSPWVDADIGAVPIAGSAQYSNGVFSVGGSGADIWGTADAFNFVYQPLNGDGSIQARVVSVQRADVWSKAGLMIRETLDRNAKHALMMVSAAKGVAMQARPATGGTSVSVSGTTSAAPRWIRIVRSGDTLTGFESADGVTWTMVGSQSIPMATAVYIGIAVTSHNTSATTTAVIDNVTVN
jgi:regulation of enolase protein 1 (concanavalin A-like superfamily)